MSDTLEKNPYLRASGAYGATAAAVDGRSLEAQALMKAAQKLDHLAERLRGGENVPFTDVGEVLQYNQKLWVLFVDDFANPEHPLPQEIKNNIISLGIFVFKRTRDLLIAPSAEKLQILININRNIATGLMTRPAVAAPVVPPQAGKTGSDSFA